MTQPLSKATNPRGAAANIVREWLDTADFPDRLLDATASDRPFIMEVVYGVAKWLRQLDWIMAQFVREEPEIQQRAILLVGLYQVFHMSDAPDFAVVNETVEAAKQTVPRSAVRFVNAVLREALRQKEATARTILDQPIGIQQSHPDVLIRRWVRQFGEPRTRRLCLWNNGRAHVVLRLNAERTDADGYMSLLAAAGIKGTPHPFRPKACIVLDHGPRVADLPGYTEGLFSVQDPSTLVAVELLDPHPGESVLDGCAAPGGKTMFIAERMRSQGRLVAADAHEDRIERLRENLGRLDAGFATVVRANLAAPLEGAAATGTQSTERFDAVLLDVPCSNTGVLRRRPDARWRFSTDRLASLTRLQSALLDGGAQAVKPGGRLVYSTCSLEPEECELTARAWAAQNPDFALASETRTFPPDTQTDGAYAALFRRKE